VWNPTTDRLCIQLDVSSQFDFQLSVVYSSGNSAALKSTKTRTIFAVEDSMNTQFKLKTALPLGFQPNSTSLVQIVIYATENISLQTPIVKPSECAPDTNSQLRLVLFSCLFSKLFLKSRLAA
jgi:hypothetical protein